MGDQGHLKGQKASVDIWSHQTLTSGGRSEPPPSLCRALCPGHAGRVLKISIGLNWRWFFIYSLIHAFM